MVTGIIIDYSGLTACYHGNIALQMHFTTWLRLVFHLVYSTIPLFYYAKTI